MNHINILKFYIKILWPDVYAKRTCVRSTYNKVYGNVQKMRHYCVR